ncbi:hypothetical protein PSYTB_12160 [Pseudomonas amygdali pv. tabaci str. ATCC 11528]|nr:hypothetical protein PSYTB_12160 [Pseudomonas amygdali pv. tabaci str. ATCC 11528]
MLFDQALCFGWQHGTCLLAWQNVSGKDRCFTTCREYILIRKVTFPLGMQTACQFGMPANRRDVEGTIQLFIWETRFLSGNNLQLKYADDSGEMHIPSAK